MQTPPPERRGGVRGGGVSARTKGRQVTELDGIWPGMAIAWEKRSKPSILGRIPSTDTGINGPGVLTHPLWSTRQTWQTVEPPTHLLPLLPRVLQHRDDLEWPNPVPYRSQGSSMGVSKRGRLALGSRGSGSGPEAGLL